MTIALATRAGAAGMALLVTLAIARTGGAAALGAFALATTMTVLVATIALAGLDGAVVRIVAAKLDAGRPDEAAGTIDTASRAAFRLACVGCAIIAAVAWPMGETATAVAILACPAFVRARVDAAALRAVGIAEAQALLIGVLPGAATLALFPLTGVLEFGAVMAFVAAWWLSAATAMFWRRARIDGGRGVQRRGTWRPLIQAGLPFAAASASELAANWAALTTVAALAGVQEAGALRAVSQLVGVVGLVVIAGDDTLAPRLSIALRRGDRASVDRLLALVRRWSLGIAGPLLVGLTLWPAAALTIVGTGFGVGAPALRWMAVLHLASLYIGPTGSALAMGVAPQEFGMLATAGLVFCVVACVALVPVMGVGGAGIALGGMVLIRRALGQRRLARWRKEQA